MKTTILTTTINIPTLLAQYAREAKQDGHADLDFVVIGDRKTPAAAAEFCRGLAEYPCAYLDIPAQQEYLRRFPALWEHLRFDSIQRRNIGLLWAYEHGAEVAITIDDDNFALAPEFVRRHQRAGAVCELPTYTSSSGWFDVCRFLDSDDGVRFYHRGYPWRLRWRGAEEFTGCAPARRRVAVNAGLWLDDPDIDALARMARQPVARGFTPGFPGAIALAPGTWSPFNSQNTALMREALPAYFLSPYIGRYDDIWASYIVTRIADHFGDAIAFGEPLVRQKRNPHDLWKDLDAERNGMILTDDFCAALRTIPLTGASYHACFGEIAAALGAAWPEAGSWTDSQREWRRRLLEGMAIWHEVFGRLGAGVAVARAAAAG